MFSVGVDACHRSPPDVSRAALGFPGVQGDRLGSNDSHHGAVDLNTGDQLTPRVARDHPASRDATDERDSQNRRQVFGAGFTSDDRRGPLLSHAAALVDDAARREYERIDRVVGDDDGAILELLQEAA